MSGVFVPAQYDLSKALRAKYSTNGMWEYITDSCTASDQSLEDEELEDDSDWSLLDDGEKKKRRAVKRKEHRQKMFDRVGRGEGFGGGGGGAGGTGGQVRVNRKVADLEQRYLLDPVFGRGSTKGFRAEAARARKRKRGGWAKKKRKKGGEEEEAGSGGSEEEEGDHASEESDAFLEDFIDDSELHVIADHELEKKKRRDNQQARDTALEKAKHEVLLGGGEGPAPAPVEQTLKEASRSSKRRREGGVGAGGSLGIGQISGLKKLDSDSSESSSPEVEGEDEVFLAQRMLDGDLSEQSEEEEGGRAYRAKFDVKHFKLCDPDEPWSECEEMDAKLGPGGVIFWGE